MTRTIPSALKAELESIAPFAAECLVLQARDGTRVRFTTLDVPISIDLGDGVEECSDGMTVAAITLAAGLDASFAEVGGPLGPVLTRAGIEGGKWDDAQAWLVRVSPLETGYAPILYGRVREARVEGWRWALEIRNAADALNQELGTEISPYCRVKFGSAKCGYVRTAVPATVSAVTDAMRFSVTLSGTFATGHFNLGDATFTGGALDGVTSENIFSWTSGGAGSGSLVLWQPLPEAPLAGDTLDLFVGCAKTRLACMGYGNMVNFRGEPDVPGSDQVLKYQVPGA